MEKIVGSALHRMNLVLFNVIKDRAGCEKLQYTPYGRCLKCKYDAWCASLASVDSEVMSQQWEE